jgi:hypothetical protein
MKIKYFLFNNWSYRAYAFSCLSYHQRAARFGRGVGFHLQNLEKFLLHFEGVSK